MWLRHFCEQRNLKDLKPTANELNYKHFLSNNIILHRVHKPHGANSGSQ